MLDVLQQEWLGAGHRVGPAEMGITDRTGRLTVRDIHLPYQFYRYTFCDEVDNCVTVDSKDDLG